MPRLPSSLKWLIDRRARVAGEIEKIERLAAKCQRLLDEMRPLQDLLAAVDQTLGLHDIAVDVSLIPSIKSQDVRINLPHGELTRSILLCLQINAGVPVSTDEIAAFIVARHADLECVASPAVALRRSVRYRLKNLCREGLVVPHHSLGGRQVGFWSLNSSWPNGDLG